MAEAVKASIIINNFNYGRFLAEAIESALNQTYIHTEVIVVDDGSTDNSREIIARYDSKIIPMLKENGGQTSTFNAGFQMAHGKIVCFLDADDFLVPTVLEETVNLFSDPEVVKVHWPLWIVDVHGRRMGGLKPAHQVPEGDLQGVVIREGPDSAIWPPTSGNAWAYSFLKNVFPLPEMEKECDVGSASADAYLSMLAPLFGRIKRIKEPHGFYRLHGKNDHSAMSFDKKLERDLKLFDYRSAVLSKYCQRMDIQVEPAKWRENSWFYRLKQAIQEVAQLTGSDTFILVDDNSWTLDNNLGDRMLPFLEKDKQYLGPPADDATAIRELERMRNSGASYLIFAWPAFWWLEHYTDFHNYIRATYQCVTDNARLVAFNLGR
jgi:glycosyltransferase involved in cell wall biosynthesis